MSPTRLIGVGLVILFCAIQDMAFTMLDDPVLSCLNKLHYITLHIFVAQQNLPPKSIFLDYVDVDNVDVDVDDPR